MTAFAQQGEATTSPAKVPALWLSALAQQGGWWATLDGQVSLGFSLDGFTDAQMTEARRMIGALSSDERRVVEQHIRDVATKGGR